MNNDEFYREIAQVIDTRTPAWVATVIDSDGSTPARIGMKQLIRLNGNHVGTIGGGELEKIVIEKIFSEQPAECVKWKFDLGTGTIKKHQTKMICGGIQEILIEPLQSGDPLFIFGGGHCGIALSKIASQCGFRVTVVDDRPDWASREKHLAASETIVAPFENASTIPVPETAYVVIMTHGHSHDEVVLRQFANRKLKYLGMLGSERKVGIVLHRMLADGFAENVLKRIYTPVGFDIGSHTPEEIAVSILAQMIAVKYGKDPGRITLSFTTKM